MNFKFHNEKHAEFEWWKCSITHKVRSEKAEIIRKKIFSTIWNFAKRKFLSKQFSPCCHLYDFPTNEFIRHILATNEFSISIFHSLKWKTGEKTNGTLSIRMNVLKGKFYFPFFFPFFLGQMNYSIVTVRKRSQIKLYHVIFIWAWEGYSTFA